MPKPKAKIKAVKAWVIYGDEFDARLEAVIELSALRLREQIERAIYGPLPRKRRKK